MTQAELAAGLGISQQATAKCVRRGMPTSSVGDAILWRNQHVRPRRGTPRPTAPRLSPPPPAITSGDPEELREAKELARQTYQLARSADAAAMPGLMSAYKHAREAINAVERGMVSRAIDAGTLLHADQVRSMLAERDGKIIALLEALPESVAPSANPHDPELARSVVADAVEQLRVTVAAPGFV